MTSISQQSMGLTVIQGDRAGVNMIDGGSHYYDTYECADGRWISIGAIEPPFYALLRAKLGLTEDSDFDAQNEESEWPMLKQRLSSIFRTRTRDEWCVLLEGTDACFAPVLSMTEAPLHPHNIERRTFIEVGGVIQPAPAPRFSASTTETPRPAPTVGADGEALLADLGYQAGEIAALKARGVLG